MEGYGLDFEGWVSAATCAESWARRGSRGGQDATLMFRLLDLRSS